MSSVVFLRGVNVGGHKTFRPSVLVEKLAHLGIVNVQAAGTFVIPGRAAQGAIRAAFVESLPFEAEIMICRGSDVLDLVASEPFQRFEDQRCYVSVLSRRPAEAPRLPLCQPAGDRWEVKLIAVSGVFALSLWRRLGKSPVDVNGVVEKGLGLRATTRSWNTILKVCELLRT